MKETFEAGGGIMPLLGFEAWDGIIPFVGGVYVSLVVYEIVKPKISGEKLEKWRDKGSTQILKLLGPLLAISGLFMLIRDLT